MPATQEQLQAMARDGRYAGNAGAIAGDGHGSHGIHAMRIHSEGMAGMPAMQEQLPAMAMDGGRTTFRPSGAWHDAGILRSFDGAHHERNLR
jgi:hypothetical protein